MSMHHVHTLVQLAARRDGLVLLSELAEAGVDRHVAARWRAAGVVEQVAPGVLRVASHPASWRQCLWRALALAGEDAVVSHRAAAVNWDLISPDRHPVEITVPRWDGQDHHDVLVHRSTDLTRSDVRTVAGFPTTSVDRTLLDLAGVVDGETLEAAYDNALRRRLTTPEKARQTLERLARRGRRGAGPYRGLLDARAGVAGIAATRFEVKLTRLIREHGLPAPVRQHVLRDPNGQFVARFDAAYPPVQVGLEADSEAWHMDRQRFVADRTRRNRAEALGWRVPCFTWHHLTREPSFVADTIDRTLVAAGWNWRDDPAGTRIA